MDAEGQADVARLEHPLPNGRLRHRGEGLSRCELRWRVLLDFKRHRHDGDSQQRVDRHGLEDLLGVAARRLRGVHRAAGLAGVVLR